MSDVHYLPTEGNPEGLSPEECRAADEEADRMWDAYRARYTPAQRRLVAEIYHSLYPGFFPDPNGDH